MNARSRGAVCGAVFFGLAALAGSAEAACQGPGAPTTGTTRCVTGILIPGNPLQSFDIGWVNPERGEYYLADRANAGIDIINTRTLAFERTLGGFTGLKLNSAGTAIDTAHSGPDGVATHHRWLYAGDGNSTLKVFDLGAPTAGALKQSLFTGSSTRVDQMALTPDGRLLLAVNNAEDPPFATLFAANGDDPTSHVSIITKVTIDPRIVPAGYGFSFAQPTWDPQTSRFYASLPKIAENPPTCSYGQQQANPNVIIVFPPPAPLRCSGAVVVIDPATLTAPTTVIGAYNATTNTGVVPLVGCGPNGITRGTHGNLLVGCTPANLPGDTTTVIINGVTWNYISVAGITGSDEVWFNPGDRRYYLGASAAIRPAGSPLGAGAVLGIIDETSMLVATIPQSSGSHSVAADAERNLIFVPQVATGGIGGDTNTTAGAGSATVGQLICGSAAGCIAVYRHDPDGDNDTP